MQATNEFEQACLALVVALGLGKSSDVVAIESLTGGVSSEIARVDLPGRSICVKFALERLKVEAEWYAPIRRNAAEYCWLEFVSATLPDNVPRLFGRSDELGGFAMEFLAGPNVRNWKADLLSHAPVENEVRAVARIIGTIHFRSVGLDLAAMGFANQSDFDALRIEPYLESLIPRHPDIAGHIADVAQGLQDARIALVHGDVSPKNILFVGSRPVLLDAECATISDPVFDVAFCLNHFLLKAVYAPMRARALLAAVEDFMDEYLPAVSWEAATNFERRLAKLLPMLLLARVDGKSPVEFLDGDQQVLARRFAKAMISSEVDSLRAICKSLENELS